MRQWISHVRLSEGGKERRGRCVVAEGLAHVGEAIDIPRAEDEAAAQLKWIQPQFVLAMAGGAGAIAALEIIAAKNVKHIGATQVGDGVRLPMFVDEQRKVDSRFFLENARIVAVAKADGREGGAFVEEDLLVFAQLRDVLTAENSSIVTKKNDDSRFVLPQRAQANFLAKGVGENDVCKLLAESFPHDGPSLKTQDSSVKAAILRAKVKRAIGGFIPRQRLGKPPGDSRPQERRRSSARKTRLFTIRTGSGW